MFIIPLSIQIFSVTIVALLATITYITPNILFPMWFKLNWFDDDNDDGEAESNNDEAESNNDDAAVASEDDNKNIGSDSRITFLVIDGNIGAGKTALFDDLHAHLRSVLDERGIGGHIKLCFMEEDLLGYITQVTNMRKTLERIHEDLKKHPTNHWVMVSKRSIYTIRHIYMHALKESGDISEVEMQTFVEFYEEVIKDFPIPTMVYLRTPPETCFKQAQSRTTYGKTFDLDLEYLQKIHYLYDEFMGKIIDHELGYQICARCEDMNGGTFKEVGRAVEYPGEDVLDRLDAYGSYLKYAYFGPEMLVIEGSPDIENSPYPSKMTCRIFLIADMLLNKL